MKCVLILVVASCLSITGVSFSGETAKPANDAANKFIELFSDHGSAESKDAEANLRARLAQNEKSLGVDHVDTLATCYWLAFLIQQQGRSLDAKPFAQRAFDGLKKTLKADDAILRACESLWELCKDATENGPNELLSQKRLDAFLLGTRGKLPESEVALRSVIEECTQKLGKAAKFTLDTRANLASVLQRELKTVEAEKEYRDIFRIRERLLGKEHRDTLHSREELALFMEQKEEINDSGNNIEAVMRAKKQAAMEYREILKVRERVLGMDDVDTLKTCWNLANCLLMQHELKDAKFFARRAYEGAKKTLKADDPTIELYQMLWDSFNREKK